jgi:DNA replication and repair protein RecF
MSLQSLSLENLRCIAAAELDFDGRCNLISGANASGKTTLLEAIFILGRGRSFRASRLAPLIRSGRKALRIVGRVRLDARSIVMGFEADHAATRARVDGRPATTLADLATALPVQAIDPDVHRLIEGAPAERRRYIDWGVFHVEPRFVDHWRRYQRALRQRNAALRSGERPAAVRVWDPELIESGEQVSLERTKYLEALAAPVQSTAQRLLGGSIELELRRGWSADVPLGQALDASWSRDMDRQLTHVGPHRAELLIRFDGHAAKGRVSRGQQKLLAAALLLGQLLHDSRHGSRIATLLVDDPAAELDTEHLERLLSAVQELPVQLFITALNPDQGALKRLNPGRRFHVEHGKITALL